MKDLKCKGLVDVCWERVPEMGLCTRKSPLLSFLPIVPVVVGRHEDGRLQMTKESAQRFVG